MKRISLIFIAISIICLFLSDIEISILHPFLEFSRLLKGIVTPNFFIIFEFYKSIINTLVFGFSGLSIGVFLSIFLIMVYKFQITVLFCSTIRSVHEIFWVFLFLPILGLNPLCGAFAIAIPYAGILAKGYSEILDEADLDAYKSLNYKSGFLSIFFYTVFPVVYDEVKHFISYRLECAIKSSAVLGFIGLPTIGFHLETFFRKGLYSEAAALLFVFFGIIGILKYLVKEKIVPIYCLITLYLISKTYYFNWNNIVRFFAYDIVPWPMRREGFLNNTYEISLNIPQTVTWLKKIICEEGVYGIVNTVILCQIALVVTGIIAICLLFTISRHFLNRYFQYFFNGILIVLRTTPEYILAYVFIQIMGPSMLPAIIAIAIHNGAVVAYLTLKSTNLIVLPIDTSTGRINQYFFEILPRIYGNFFGNLFYRWETMIRESALLGILGIYTIGFYVDSAISDDKMDKAIVLLFHMVLLNSLINFLSSYVRRQNV